MDGFRQIGEGFLEGFKVMKRHALLPENQRVAFPPGRDRISAHRPPSGQREHQQAGNSLRLERGGQPPHQIEQRAELLHLLVEVLVEPIGFRMRASIGDPAGGDAEQRLEKFLFFGVDLSARRTTQPEQPDGVFIFADRKNQMNASVARRRLVEDVPGV